VGRLPGERCVGVQAGVRESAHLALAPEAERPASKSPMAASAVDLRGPRARENLHPCHA
jgi:hypothetical protein